MKMSKVLKQSLEQSTVPGSYHGNHWTGAHVLDEGRKEWFILQVAVVIHQEILRGLQQETAQLWQFPQACFHSSKSRTQPTPVAPVREKPFNFILG